MSFCDLARIHEFAIGRWLELKENLQGTKHNFLQTSDQIFYKQPSKFSTNYRSKYLQTADQIFYKLQIYIDKPAFLS